MSDDEADIMELEARIQDTSYRGEQEDIMDDERTSLTIIHSDNSAPAADHRICIKPSCGKSFSTFEEGCNMFALICPSCFTVMRAEAATEEGNCHINTIKYY